MKKSVLTITALSMLMGADAVLADFKTKITPYGSVRVGLESNDIDGQETDTDGRDFLSRFGLKGSQKITQGLSVIGRIEYGLDATDSKNESNLRLGFVGLKGDLGQLTFGSQTLIWHKFVRGAFFNDGTDTLRLGTIRDSDQLNYLGKSGGFSYGLGLQFKGKTGTGDDAQSNSDSVDTAQFGASYKSGNFILKGALLKDSAGENTGTLLGLRPEMTFGGTKVALVYFNASDDFDVYGANLCKDGGATTTAGLYAKQKIGSGAIHGRFMTKSCDTAGPEADSIKLEYVHFLSKKARFWVSGESLDKEAGADDTELQVGFRFDF
ncbi:MAG: porin [Arenicella sp.]